MTHELLRRTCAAGCAFALAMIANPLSQPTAYLASPAGAAEVCKTEIAKDDLTDDQVQALYDCLAEAIHSGVQKSGLPEARAYRDWTVASTVPFISATHGSRFVRHYVNATGKDAYLKWEELGGRNMPVGSITAKESFDINKKGEVNPGPFFLMEKVAVGTLPETDDWKYTLMMPNGKVIGNSGTDTGMKVKFCHDCHLNVLDDQDGMFFPEEDYRVKTH